MTDEASFLVRKRMMEQQETEEWGHRETEIDDNQAERLALLQQTLMDREQDREIVAEQRVEDVRQKAMQNKDAKLTHIQRKRIQALRKLTKQREDAETQVDVLTNTGTAAGLGRTVQGRRPRQRDIIGEYANFNSKVYAPKTRFGQQPEKSVPAAAQTSTMVDAEDLLRPGTLDMVEQNLPKSVTMARTKLPQKAPLRYAFLEEVRGGRRARDRILGGSQRSGEQVVSGLGLGC